MKPRKQITKDMVALFNQIRKEKEGKPMKRAEVWKDVKAIFQTSDQYIIPAFVRTGVLKQNEHTREYFYSTAPVFIEKLDNCFKIALDMKKKTDAYQKSLKKNQEPEFNIASAIDGLKKIGEYKILKRKFDVDMALKNPTRTVGDFISWEEV